MRREFTACLFTMTVAALMLVPCECSQAATGYDVTILAGDGSLTGRFRATLDDQHISDIKIGPDSKIWLARSDNSHSRGVPNPDDMVAVYDMAGTELRTIRTGSMRDPLAITWDSSGNLYVAGEDVNFVTDIYKFNTVGNFLLKFHTAGWSLIDEYNDLVTTSTDRVYASAWWGGGASDQMTEFDTSGGTVNTFSPTGPAYFHRSMALRSNSLWVYTPKNGPGDDLVRQFNLAGNQISSFSVTAAVPGSSMVGLEISASNTLFMLDRNTAILYELNTAGNVVGQTQLQGLSGWIADFTFSSTGSILVANQGVPWVDLGHGLAGTGGQTPFLIGTGTLQPGTPATINLSHALPGSTAFLFIGLSEVDLPFRGGTQVPSLDFPLVPLPVDGSGKLMLGTNWPPVPSGTAVYFQYWVLDPSGPFGASASNGVVGTTP